MLTNDAYAVKVPHKDKTLRGNDIGVKNIGIKTTIFYASYNTLTIKALARSQKITCARAQCSFLFYQIKAFVNKFDQ